MQDLTGMVRKTENYYFAFGGLADVWRGEWIIDTEFSNKAPVLAIKVIRSTLNDPDYLDRLKMKLKREGEVWSTLDHPNITPFFGVSYDLDRPAAPSLICPYYSNGDAPAYLRRNPAANRALMMSQVAAGLSYLHRLHPPIIHGDIKGTNILINDKGEASITDFGLSRILETSGFTTKTAAGTCRWMAYELIAVDDDTEDDSTPPATAASDVWAFAMTAIEIFTDRLPFHNFKYDSAVILAIMKHGRPPRDKNSEITDDVWFVLEKCWDDNPIARPSMTSLALFFDVAHTLWSAHPGRRLAESEITRILSPSVIAPTRARTGGILSRIRSLGRSALGIGDRQHQRQGSSGSDKTTGRPRRRLTLPLSWRISKKPEEPPGIVSSLSYRCNWPECPESFDALGECQTHEFGHRGQWTYVGT